jgi:methyl-accepting chemotaxis protein
MARIVEVFKKNGLEVERLEADQQASELRTAQQRKADMIKMAGSASSQVLSAAKSLSGDSNRLKLEVGKFLNTVRAA